MRKMFLLSVWLFSVRCQEFPLISLSVQEGQQAVISWKYDSGYESYPKYFLKGDYGIKKTLITTDKKVKGHKVGKYFLHDDTKNRILHVTISNVNLDDAGTYWCQIDAYTFDPITEIQLRVVKAPPARKPPKPPNPPKPPLASSNPPIPTTVQVVTTDLQQSAGSAESVSSTALWSSSPQVVHTESSPLDKRVLSISVTAAVLLLSLSVLLYFGLRKHKQDPAASGHEVSSLINTNSEQLLNMHSFGQPTGPDPPVSTGSSDYVYAAVKKHRGPDACTSVCHPVTVQTPVADTVNSSTTSDASMQTVSPRIGEDVHLIYSTVHFTKGASQTREQTRLAAGPSEVYATIRTPQT